MNKRILLIAIACGISIISFSAPASQPFYLGIFGGGGTFSADHLNQTGTALYGPGQGGPLAVNANGSGSTSAIGVGGINFGYQWKKPNDQPESQWGLVPAAEFEGYYLGGTQTGENLNNITNRLPEHDFRVTYPMNTGVLLVNGVLNIGNFYKNKLHSYVGAGIGTAIISISNANSSQTAPTEPGINHYNSNPNASDWTFATQAKAGLLLDLTSYMSIFAEYRFLYLSSSNYTFGSTQYPTHIATTNWSVNISGLCNNIGTIGLQFKL